MTLSPPQLTESERRQLFQATAPVAGWLHPREQSLLYWLGKITDGPVLELGCYHGKSTVCLFLGRQSAHGATTHVVVDLFQDYIGVISDFEADFRRNVQPYVAANDLKVLRMSTFEAGPSLNKIIQGSAGFSGIFIDADHHYASVVKDAQLASSLLAPGGWMAFHDAFKPYTSEVMPGCRATGAIDGFKYIGAHHSIMLLQRPVAGERVESWKEAARIRRHAREKKLYLALAHSPLRKLLFAAVRMAQRMRA
jgi:predicted O-methyltransferase YrrM